METSSVAPGDAAGDEDHVDAGKTEREAEPGDGVLQVIVGQIDHELARAWGRRRRAPAPPARCRTAPPPDHLCALAMASGSRRYQTLCLRIVGGREQAARFRPAHHADDVDGAARRRRPARRVLAVERHVAAIDDDDAAAGKPRRREHPVAGLLARRGGRRSRRCRPAPPRRAGIRRKRRRGDIRRRRRQVWPSLRAAADPAAPASAAP